MNFLIRKMLDLNGGAYEWWLRNREKKYVYPSGVTVKADIPYLPDGKEFHKMDVFSPENPGKKLPVILNLHGGGLVLCTRHVNRPFCAELAKRGFVVFNIDYPLLPETDAAGILGDVCGALRYVETVLEQYGGDRSQMFLTGDSAGAFLSVYAVAAGKNPAIAAAAGIRPVSLPIRAMGLISGMFYTTLADDPGLFLRKELYGENWKSHPLQPYLKPDCPEVASLMPPTILVTAKFDKLRKASVRFYRGLQAAGVPSKLLDFPAHPMQRHDFVILQPESGSGKQAVEELVCFLRRFAQNGD